MKRSNPKRRTHAILTASVAVGLLATLAGCAHSQRAEALSSPEPMNVASAQPAPAPEPAVQPATTQVQPVAVKTESIYFDFDRSELKPEGQQFLAGFGALLAKHPELHVRIEGNCDERGTAQYNIALGYRRANSAKQYLLDMGSKEDQITTISYGKERPRAMGHDEAAWRQNRRDDFVPDRDTVSAQPVAVNP